MGIEIRTEAEIKRKWPFGRRPGRDAMLRGIREAIEGAICDPLMREALRFEHIQHRMLVHIHPALASMEFTWRPEGAVEAWVKTSCDGPGYHAFVVDILDAVADSCRLDWDWDGADEAGYAIDRDFAGLQAEMAGLLRNMSGALLEMDSRDYSMLAINWPLTAPRVRDGYYSVSPSGPLSREWWESVRSAGEQELVALGRHFFVWWDRETNAAFWLKTGRALLWYNVPWRPPASEDEHEICVLAVSCLDKAKELDGAADIPMEELRELKALLDAGPSGDCRPPCSGRIGYRRSVMNHDLTGLWSVDLPGYYYRSDEQDGTEAVLWFGDRTVRGTSFVFEGKGDPSAEADELLDEHRRKAAEGAETVEHEKANARGWAEFSRVNEDGREFHMLQGLMVVPGKMCIVSIIYLDPTDKPWAIETFKSVSHPEGSDDDD